MTLPLKPKRGGFLRPFGCGWFVHEFLMGNRPGGAPVIDLAIGAPQADMFHHYKLTLMRATALDRATRTEEKRARREKRSINPENIEELAKRYFTRIPYKAQSCRYHSFVVYFSNLQRLGWVEATGREEPSALQDNFTQGPPRRYYRLTASGRAATDSEWANPRLALYGKS